ncbi:MAG: NAD-dependent epimerase/dehydratase family protein [Bacteroidetes bacterium]|nr:NAD-dependent epimerase/dehydratase family protein [Bacteroidota bacterium]
MVNKIILEEVEGICKNIDINELNDSAILVTGASGLLGSTFITCLYYLKTMGCRFTVFAQTLSDFPPHIFSIIQKGGFNVIQADLANFNNYSNLPEVDLIIHAAGYAQPARFLANPAATLQVNTSATIALLNNLKKGGKFLFLSSAEVYCGLTVGPFSEEMIGSTTPFHPRAAYIEGKRCGEAICSSFRASGVLAKVVRLGDVYGPGTRKHDKRALNNFIEKALLQGSIDLLDYGSAVRTYCYISDAVELLWKVLLYGIEPVYNIGGRSTCSIAELAQKIGYLTETDVVFPKTSKGIVGAPPLLELDVTRVETEFHKLSYVSLEDGLRATIAWQRELYAERGIDG